MKKIVLFCGVIAIFIFVAYMDSPEDTYHGFIPDLHVDSNTDSEEVSEEAVAQDGQESVEVFSSVTHELVETFEKDGYVIEKYREYELYENEDGVIVEKKPTSNFDFLRYKVDE